MTVAVVILCYNGAKWLPSLFENLAAQTFADLKIYLVDNNSADDSVALTRQDFPDVGVIQMPSNLGYSMAYNAALPIVFREGAEWAVLANTDVKLEPTCIAELLAAAKADSRIGVAGPAFREWDSDGPNYYMRGVHPRLIREIGGEHPPREVDWVEGSLLMLKRECFEQAGPLDPYFFFYWEEVDFCRRARRLGWKVVLAARAVARHFGGGSTGQTVVSDFARLKAKNHYAYKLTDPGRPWTLNWVRAWKLLTLRLTSGVFKGDVPLQQEVQAFTEAAKDAAALRRKWLRDRAGEKPPSFDRDMSPVSLERIASRQAPS